MAGLIDWLPVWNMALKRVGANLIPAGTDITTSSIPEAQIVNRFWANAVDRVLSDHDWKVATKTVFLGHTTVAFVPTLPQGKTEYATGKLTKYYLDVPFYEATPTTTGAVPFEIVRLLSLNLDGDWFPEDNKIMFDSPLANVNVYGRFVIKPEYSAAVRDGMYIDALKSVLSILIAPPLTSKDNTRDQMLRNDMDIAFRNARLRDNTGGDSTVQGQKFWMDAVASATGSNQQANQ